ncbi:radical SAM family heme chaperone HemW [Enterobacteriaceae endosymbiont of Macroplea mutica]|uniref:radical SAM family heme chaperone HemW n=1 Tax=Enterobacteriaceae endosymbiont of Macroplea mutica TaxID=2675791 RepID=UPI001449CE4F|nr:radical SAM family heme chaperone HemW [Enterobacteriaceae endosymbiont of Macroplea mutica]QJC31303.1 radical SAM family heme chaperone HemW [Enterobacteriaceae endosymbiont of Macroplea mutica]
MYINKYINCSLYIHIPWCIKKCWYCDFFSINITNKHTDETMQKKYIDHIILDLKNTLFVLKQYIYVTSIFFGGGTPNLIKTEFIQYLLYEIKKLVYIPLNIEISMEINPTYKHHDNIIKYSKQINRISIGAQSFNEKYLHILGRMHTVSDIYNTINILTAKHINNINIDLMYGLPGQTLEEMSNDLYQALSLRPNHISWYQLSVKNSQYKHYQLPHEELLWKMFILGHKIFHKYKYIHYEISSFSKSKKDKCQHNLNYWYNKDYLGLGCSAHSKITDINFQTIHIIKNKNFQKYMLGNYITHIDYFSKKDKLFNFFLNRARLFKKIKKKELIINTRLTMSFILPFITQAILYGYLKQNNKYFIITKKGYLFLNDFLEIFI